MISRLEEENVELASAKEQLWKYVRELEQKNDDLERGKRYIIQVAIYLTHDIMVYHLFQSNNVFIRRF